MCQLSPGPPKSRGVPARGHWVECLAGVLKTVWHHWRCCFSQPHVSIFLEDTFKISVAGSFYSPVKPPNLCLCLQFSLLPTLFLKMFCVPVSQSWCIYLRHATYGAQGSSICSDSRAAMMVSCCSVNVNSEARWGRDTGWDPVHQSCCEAWRPLYYYRK